MNAKVANARKKLRFVDPAEFTPKFAWKKSAREEGVERVFCEGADLVSAAASFGTPTYFYSRAAITDAYREFDRGLGKIPHTICFAVKSNGNLSILQYLAKMGSGFDIVSGGELEHLGHLGVRGDRIVFSGVGKTRYEIRDALQYSPSVRKKRAALRSGGILLFNVESEAELEVLLEESERNAKRGGKIPAVAIRVNPDVAAGGHPHIATGSHTHKFGLDWPEARRLYLAHKDSKYLHWKGISAHIGSQIVSLDPFRRAFGRIAGYVSELRGAGIRLEYLDLGGGLGVRYTTENTPARQDYARMVAKCVRPLGLHLLLEPGRSIIAAAGILLTKVIYTKRNRGKTFVVVDAAMNDLLRPALYGAVHPITRIAREAGNKQETAERVDIVGPVCETGDCLLRDWPLGEVKTGDLLAIWVAGAYGMSQASNYNARTRPSEVLIDGTRSELIRRRETQQDLLRTDPLAPKRRLRF
ncbi:MAG TPA: diaminopimelate decarboxylase [Candidatus Acidoferrum sp.]|nr:diaminopimelate decarboxylase [Candidatus Acidoferrum sp.]